MVTATHREQFTYPGYLDSSSPLTITKSKTMNGVDILFLDSEYNDIYNEFPDRNNSYSILDFQRVSEFDIVNYTRYAINHLEKKENIVVGYLSEALNSAYWNIVFDYLQHAGFKKILFVDGGLTAPHTLRHLENVKIAHLPSPMFFQTLFRPSVVEHMPAPGNIEHRSTHYLCLSRLVRQERIYFTKKLLDNSEILSKGIVSCGWGTETLDCWTSESNLDQVKLLIDSKDISKFPITLGHRDTDQHSFDSTFKTAIFNVVLESSIGYDHRSHNDFYNPLSFNWKTVSSDRIFFTEKTAKAFLMNQIPLMIAAPGMVQVLRQKGFDMFDDIVDHSYDKEDNIFKRCDMVFAELTRLTSSYTVDGWISIMKKRNFNQRFFNNHTNVRNLGSTINLSNWVLENF